jgi:3-deoxy-manno-octulosonate cytidylyltransferase (CMP-KDO synthetase)
MTAVIIIPARYGSTRFPGKPLAPILGLSLLERTWRIAKAVTGIDEVYVATDDERIQEHVENFGGQAVMTPPSCGNGTERALACLESRGIEPDVIVNLQGDAVLTPPSVIQPLVDCLLSDSTIEIATPATRMSFEAYEKLLAQKSTGTAGGTLVTFDKNFRALYFSKSIIPYIRNPKDFVDRPNQFPVYRHIGLYGYRLAALKKYVSLPTSHLETAEGLEQLRALENGMNIRVVEVDYEGRTHWSVDSPEDAKLVEQIILKEGELVGTI